MESLSALLAPSSLVLLAGAVQTAAMLFRNQIIMRCILIFGTALYIIYYLKIVSPPLYEAAFISTAIGASTLYGLLLLLLDRSQLMLSSDLIPVYKAMGTMEPGQFRRLMRLGHRHILETDTVLTHEGKKPENLFFIKSGTVIAEKAGTRFRLTAPLFIGEIAYITGAPASATIRAEAGADVVEWHSATLQRATRRKPNLGLALDARLASDLARKVATSVTFEAIDPKAPKPETQS
jgi:CRP-like cAMP-binding protein